MRILQGKGKNADLKLSPGMDDTLEPLACFKRLLNTLQTKL